MATAERQASEQGALAVRLFGHTEMSVDGAPFKFATPRKSLHVLAYLLLHRSSPVTREYLAFVLFPDEEESVARTKLRSTLGDMQKILPAPLDRYITIDGENIAWNHKASLWLDVDAFVEASEDPARLGEAIELYRGDLLPQIYDEWIESARDRFRNAYVRCLSEAASAARRGADFARAIEMARLVLAIDPWREDVVRRIVTLRYESGDRAGALSEYREFAKRLREEMNTEPMPETAALAERVRQGLELTGEVALPAHAANLPPVLPFVGRDAQLNELLDAWSGVARGRGTLAFVSGEAGIGKSRLAQEFAVAVEERGGRVLAGRTSFPESVAYEGVTDALRGALPLVCALKADLSLASLATIVPEIGARVKVPELPRLSTESERIRLFDAVGRTLSQLGAQRPLLLLLEDLHWAGAATCDMLLFLVRRIAGSRVMVLVTFRDDETPRTHPLQRLRNEAQTTLGTENLWLRRLSEFQIAELRVALPELQERRLEELISVSQGHPHFLTQLVLDARDGAPDTAPTSLRGLLTRRIERLSPDARTAAEIAACIGDHFSRDALREVSAWDDTTLGNALDELLDRRIVRESSGRALFEYTFAHQAVHEAIALDVPAKRDVPRRRRVARVLEELYPEHSSELAALVARHYDIAGDHVNAARCYLAAARHSISLGALDEARSQCERGLELAADLRLRCDLLLERATIEGRRGEPAAWNAALQDLETNELHLGDLELHRITLLQRFEYGRTCDDRPVKVRTVEELRRSLADDDRHWEAQAYLCELRLAFDDNRFDEARAAGEKALERSRGSADYDTTAEILSEMAIIEAQRGHLSEADSIFRETAEAAAHATNRGIWQRPLRSGWAVAHQRRDTVRALEAARQLLELAIQLGDRPLQGRAHDMLAVSITATGKNVAAARRHFAMAIELGEENRQAYTDAGSRVNQAILETRVGFFDRALALAEKALEKFSGRDDVRGRLVCLDNLVFLRAYAGKIDAARAAAKEALALAQPLQFGLNEASVLENLAFTEARAGNLERAHELARSSFDARIRTESQIWSCKTLADTAIWHAQTGNVAAARESVRRLLADEAGIVAGTDFPTYCYWAAAQVFHLDGRAADAKLALDKGRRLLQTTADDLEGADRAQYLSIPWNADLIAAAESGKWPNPPR